MGRDAENFADLPEWQAGCQFGSYVLVTEIISASRTAPFQAYHTIPLKSKKVKGKIKLFLVLTMFGSMLYSGMIADMKTAELWKLVGGLSEPSKMPCYGYSIPAQACKVGSLLRKVKGSTCGSCYALKGNYMFPVVRKALERRLAAIERPEWVEAMTTLIDRKTRADNSYFRWHDAGDLQNAEHLAKIVQIAENLPHIRFWLPTRETAIVAEYLENACFPINLTVRLSAPMVGRESKRLAGTVGSSVNNLAASQCPAPQQENACKDCRNCWDPNIVEVSYRKH